MNFKPTLLLLFIIISLFTSCKKQYYHPSLGKLLTRTDWKMITWTSTPAFPDTINNTGKTYSDIFELETLLKHDCALDQSYHFDSGPDTLNYFFGKSYYYVGKNKCNITTPRYVGYWSYTTNYSGKAYLLIYKDPNGYKTLSPKGYSYYLIELTEDRLVLAYNDTLKNPTRPFVMTQVFVPTK